MSKKSLEKEVVESLKQSSPDAIQKILDAWKAELLTFQIHKQLKKKFVSVPKLMELASKITIHTYNWMQVDYRIMEKCTFSISYNTQIAFFSWSNYYEKGGELDTYSLFYCDNKLQPNDWKLLQTSDADCQIEIQLDQWKKIARKFNVLDVKVYDFAYFIGFVCSVMKESIITIDDEILWYGPDGQKSWDQINPFTSSVDKMPDAVYFVLSVARKLQLIGQRTVRLKVKNEKGINAIKASLENETNIVLVQQADISDDLEIGGHGLSATIVEEKREEDGTYTIRVRPIQEVVLKEIFRSPTCNAAKIQNR